MEYLSLDRELKTTAECIDLINGLIQKDQRCSPGCLDESDVADEKMSLLDWQARLLERYNQTLKAWRAERERIYIESAKYGTDPMGDRW